jgi:predicted Rossmann-fold nucleotide-binding protein
MSNTVCVYCSSSDALSSSYFQAATDFGALLAQNHYTLIYGGGRIGLMGALARAVHQHGGKVRSRWRKRKLVTAPPTS